VAATQNGLSGARDLQTGLVWAGSETERVDRDLVADEVVLPVELEQMPRAGSDDQPVVDLSYPHRR
jgi:hypothetical protein